MRGVDVRSPPKSIELVFHERQWKAKGSSRSGIGHRAARRLVIRCLGRAALLIIGPLVGLWWLLLLAPRPWPPGPGVLWAASPDLPLVGVAVAAAVVILASTGSLIRWLP